MRKVGGQIVGDAVSEIVLLLVVAQILERQHDDRKSWRDRELVFDGSGQETRRVARAPGERARRKKRESERRRQRWPATPRRRASSSPAWGGFCVAGAPWRSR